MICGNRARDTTSAASLRLMLREFDGAYWLAAVAFMPCDGRAFRKQALRIVERQAIDAGSRLKRAARIVELPQRAQRMASGVADA